MSKWSELALDRELALALQASPELASWLLRKTRYASSARSARLLHQEQAAARSAPYWWKHWWCRIPGHGDSETDIFLVFEDDRALRFALHIENKLASGKFTMNQPELYRVRGDHMLRTSRYLSYTSYATVLLAPIAFRNRYPADSAKFDHFVSHEEIATFVPAFGVLRPE